MIRFAIMDDLDILVKYDHHISKDILINSIKLNNILIVEENNTFIGWLRYNLFWDNTPFMNMLFILEPYRNKKHGKALVFKWEEHMKTLGYDKVLTSTFSNENSKYFYEHLGYHNIGGFTLENEPYEIIYYKSL